MSDIPVNAQIAASFGWNVWNDGPGGRWFMDRVHPEKVGTCQVMLVPDYVAHLRNFLVDDLPVQVPARELEYIALENAISRMGWPEIRAFQEELRKGQSIYEDAGGYFMRGFRRLFGLPQSDEAVLTYRRAAKAMVDAARREEEQRACKAAPSS